MADFTTTFTLTENPMSEGGIWKNGLAIGLDWKNCRTSGGRAFGTQVTTDGFNDSTAILTGTWANNQTVQATVFVSVTNTASFQEVEIRLRSTMTAHSSSGYEVLWSVNPSNQYCQIVRWNGAFGDFTLLNAVGTGVANGDVVKATIIGTTITCYINGSSVLTITDSTYSSGNPGIGFYLNSGSAVASNYGFSDFTVIGDTGGFESAVAITGAPIF